MDKREVWPEYAYVPGRTPRHAEDAFDVVRQTAKANMSPEQLTECTAFRLGLRYLDAGFYWEAHELFEPVWMALPNPSAERQFVQCLIQIANGYLKVKMDKPKAASRLVTIARGLFSNVSSDTDDHGRALMGVEKVRVQALIDSLGEQLIMHYNAGIE